MIVFFYGLPGSGKTYLTDRIAQEFDFEAVELDDLLPEAAPEAVAEKRFLTPEERANFLSYLIDFLNAKHAEGINIVTGTVMSKQADREKLLREVEGVKLIFIAPPEQELLMERLETRDHNLTAETAIKARNFFEFPSNPQHTFDNSAPHPTRQELENLIKTLELI